MYHGVVHPDYYCGLDANLSRLDQLQRPELTKGTVDFSVSKEYWALHPPPRISPLYQPILPLASSSTHRIPQPMDYVFLIEVSRNCVDSGFTRIACEAITRILYGSSGDEGGVEEQVEGCFPAKSRISIITFDNTIHFYDFSVRAPSFLTRGSLTKINKTQNYSTLE